LNEEKHHIEPCPIAIGIDSPQNLVTLACSRRFSKALIELAE